MGPEKAKQEVGGISDDEIERKIQQKGLTAPRVKPQDIECAIKHETYQRIQGTTVTVCVLTLINGFTVVGHSACVSEANFNAQLGEEIAHKKAFDKCWELFGFQLATEQTVGSLFG